MYSVALGDQGFSVFCEKVLLLEALGVEVVLDDGRMLSLTPDAESIRKKDGEFRLRYVSGDEVAVELFLTRKEKHLVIHLAASIQKGISWPYATFYPLEAVRLKVKGLGGHSGLCAHYLYNSWWTRPHFDPDLRALPARTQSLLTGKQEGQFTHILTFCDARVKGELRGDADGMVLLASPQKAGLRRVSGVVAMLGFGSDPYELMNQSIAVGRRLLPYPCKPKEGRLFPGMFDYLGWCSWDACYLDVSEEAVLAKAAEFREKKVPVKWMLVDDGWSEECDRRLMSFRENRDKFPSGFKGLKQQLREDYGIPWLGAWHALTGQWEGVDHRASLPEGIGASLESIDELRALPPSDSAGALRFWCSWHSYLSRQGIDFVKVDVQGNLANHYRYRAFPGELSNNVHEALEASAHIHFNGALINCMGMAPEQLWGRPSSLLSRNSDDFFPRQPGNLREHALQNAYNALYHDGFYQGDWDMWWSDHKDARSHALLRVLSGGPVYTSDPCGKTLIEPLMPLVLRDGRVIRCDRQGKPVRRCLFNSPLDSGETLIIWNSLGDVAVAGLFNLNNSGQQINALVAAGDLELEEEALSFVAVVPGRELCSVVEREQAINLSLPAAQAELVLFYPDRPLFCIGLADKYLPSFAIRSQQLVDGRLVIQLYEGGRVWLYSRKPILTITANGQSVDWINKGVLTEFFYASASEVVVEVVV
ncbi:Sip1-related alpha-galactosidase [Endozoicomonas sp. Mp262]|uniref:Sip1-related alpha-galactosidase n=1 Tax=Endozoicomonas sp. Mp262 TaxID=2919499 RepID=UPI0021D831E9